MAHATAADADLAQRTGIAVSLCISSSIQDERRLPLLDAFADSGIRMGLGSGGACRNQDVWGEMKLLALMMSGRRRFGEPDHTGWDALAMATRGGASVLGLDGGVGTLEPGKWADLCCVDLGGPATQPLSDPVAQLVMCGGPGMVSDVWVAGRQPALRRGVDPSGLAASGRARRRLGHANEIRRMTPMQESARNADPAELAKFTALAQSWWDPRAHPSLFTTSIPRVFNTSNTE